MRQSVCSPHPILLHEFWREDHVTKRNQATHSAPVRIRESEWELTIGY